MGAFCLGKGGPELGKRFRKVPLPNGIILIHDDALLFLVSILILDRNLGLDGHNLTLGFTSPSVLAKALLRKLS